MCICIIHIVYIYIVNYRHIPTSSDTHRSWPSWPSWALKERLNAATSRQSTSMEQPLGGLRLENGDIHRSAMKIIGMVTDAKNSMIYHDISLHTKICCSYYLRMATGAIQ